MITSLTNPQVKEAVKLRDGKKRREDGLFLIDGRREIQRAILSGIEVAKIFYYPGGCNKEFTELMFSSGAEMVDVSEPVLEKIAYGSRDEGAVAIARRPVRTLDSLKLSKCPLIGVAEGVEKPGNVGALLRSADGAGLDALILADCKTDLYNPNAVRASLGTIFSVPVVETTSQAAVDWLMKKGIVIFAAIVKRLPSSRLWQKFVLTDKSSRERGFVSGDERKDLIGREGTVLTELRPAGSALIDDAPVDVVSEGAYLEKGTAVKVIAVNGNRVVVRKI